MLIIPETDEAFDSKNCLEPRPLNAAHIQNMDANMKDGENIFINTNIKEAAIQQIRPKTLIEKRCYIPVDVTLFY